MENQFHLNNVKIDSFNVRGLRTHHKRKDLFRYFKNRKLDIILLQETHSLQEIENSWRKEWGGKAWFEHGTTQSRGVAVLLNKRAEPHVEVREVRQALDGRFIMIEILIGEINFVLANFYGPNEDEAEFFIQAFDILEKKDNPNMMLAGDFNTTLDPKLDSNSDSDHHPRKRAAISNYMEERELVDVWRVNNPNKYQYSWKRDCLATQSSRIDYFLVSQGLCNRIKKAEMEPGYKSDHWRLDYHFDFQSCPRGRGFWKLNLLHLKSKEFLEELNVIIDQFLWAVKENITPVQEWEYLKLEITSFCTEFSARKAKQKNRLIEKLENRIKILDEHLLQCTDPAKKEEILIKIKKTEEFLINEHEERSQKRTFHNRCKWYNESEKNSRYFFNLAKAKYNSKVINRIKTESGTVESDPKEIRKELQKFYKKLLTEKNSERPFPYVNETDNRLADIIKEELDQPLSMGELANAVKEMNDGKTPGCDGLQVEFYKVYWSRIKHVLFNAITYAIQTGQLHTSATRGIITLLPKKGRDLLWPKNWRPITLLNVDYKIYSKALALRMKKALPNIINKDQSGFMANRNINHNIRKILDIIQLAKRDNIGALVVSVDFESCFDSIAHSAIVRALEYFNFGPAFIGMVKTLLQGAEACVLNNGYTTNYIQITRSTRQGCCLSPFLALCVLELVAIEIRNNNKIKGITIQDMEHKIFQFADDMNLTLLFERETLFELIETFDIFESVTGLKVSYDKTSIYRIGSLKRFYG